MNYEGKNLVRKPDETPNQLTNVILDTDEYCKAKEELLAFHKIWKQLPVITELIHDTDMEKK